MITFHPPKKGFVAVLLLVAAGEPTGRFSFSLHRDFENRLSRN
jgi:hypothetical protein